MEEVIFKYALNFGLFPALAIYLMIFIVRDHKKSMEDINTEIKKLKEEAKTEREERINRYNEIKNDLNELIEINKQTQSYINNNLNNILLKLLDVFDDIE